MKRFILTLACLTAMLVLSESVSADVPHLINYQGYLTLTNGRPVLGTHNLTFKLYADNMPASTPLWVEHHTGVVLPEGIFHVILGSLTPIGEDLFLGSPRWIGITVDNDPEISPRMQLTSVPWAMSASMADSALAVRGGIADGHSLDASDGSPADVVNVDPDGAVSIMGPLSVDNSISWSGDHGASGYIRLGTLQICWGRAQATSGTAGNIQIQFPAAFANTQYSFSIVSTGIWGFVSAFNCSKSLSGVTYLTMLDYDGHYQTGYADWIAIGQW